jgi:hypothetical protein
MKSVGGVPKVMGAPFPTLRRLKVSKNEPIAFYRLSDQLVSMVSGH